MGSFEKNIEKAGSVANRLQIGCILVFANLFLGGFCLWGLYAGYVSWRLEQTGERTTGRVARLEEGSDSDGGCCVYSPVVEFTVNGQAHSFEGDTASYPPAYQVGEEVRVLYDPASPDTAQIDKWSERWLMPLIIIPAMLFTALLLNFFLLRSFIRNDSSFT